MEAYRAAASRPKEDDLLKEHEAEDAHPMKLLKVRGLTESAQEEWAADIAEVEAEMERVKVESEPLDQRLEKLLIRPQETTQAMQAARQPQEGRMSLARAEAVGKIVRRFDGSFAENKEDAGGPYAATILAKVVIHQTDGPTWERSESEPTSG